jgi:hypothetical protein
MTAAILSQDLLAILVLFAKGDMNASLADILSAMESFQEEYDRHFGISRADVPNLLLFKFNPWPISTADYVDRQHFKQLRLGDVAVRILQFHEAYFNDEGEYFDEAAEFSDEGPNPSWLRILLFHEAYFNVEGEYFDEAAEFSDEGPDPSWYDYTLEEYRRKVTFKKDFLEVLNNPDNHYPEALLAFLAQHGIDENFLLTRSRPGVSS